MKYYKINRSFTQDSDAKVTEQFKGVIDACTGNTAIPGIEQPLIPFKAIYTKFVESIPNLATRSKVTTAIKNENRAELNFEANVLASYIEYATRFNKAAMDSSNFLVNGDSKPVGMVGLVKNLTASTNGVNDMVIVQCKRDPNARLYSVRISKDGKNWQWFGAHTSRTVKVTGLPTNVPLIIEMRLENSQGESPWSEQITGMIGVSNVFKSIHK